MSSPKKALTQRRAAVLDVLAAASEPLSTTDIRVRLNANRSVPVVAEQVYRDLRRLADHGYVQHVRLPGTPLAFWTISTAPGPAVQKAGTQLTGMVEVAKCAVFDWALRTAPAAALDAVGLTEHARRIRATPQLTDELLAAAPAPLHPHAQALLAANREQQRHVRYHGRADGCDIAPSLNPMWAVMSTVRLDLHTSHRSQVGQYVQLVIAHAVATAKPAESQRVRAAVTDTYLVMLADADSASPPARIPVRSVGTDRERHLP